MKILHTSDWHLGQRLLNRDRRIENERVLNWLLETIKTEAIELLIVAGDIFDTMNPPNYARNLYYGFLNKIQKTNCRHVVIVGGNHDSPSMLNAPKELLQSLNIHIVGCATQPIEDEIIELRDSQGNIEAVVAAVPFLRDQDIRQSISGETSLERLERVRQGIYQHYETLGLAVEKYIELDIPILATGHLFASGATDNKDSKIYVGNLENIKASEFPVVFDYVALGHIHKAQIVEGEYHIRYSGSVIPLSFKERVDEKVIYIVDFEKRQFKSGIQTVPIPIERQLISVQGDFKSVQKDLQNIKTTSDLDTWVEVIVETDQLIPNLMDELKKIIENKPLEILSFKITNTHVPLDEQITVEDLDSLDVEEVFLKKCKSMGQTPERVEELQLTFRELLNWMENQDTT